MSLLRYSYYNLFNISITAIIIKYYILQLLRKAVLISAYLRDGFDVF